MTAAARALPTEPRLFRATVVDARPLSPNFRRVTITGDDLDEFDFQGLDHWFRLFFPLPHQGELVLPTIEGDRWWQPYLDIPEQLRPHCANYTVASHDAGSATMEIDVVMHAHDGEWGGTVARWAADAQPGQPLALLDQGVLWNPPADTREILIASDETGWPGVRGILAGMDPQTRGLVIVELPEADDHEPPTAPAGVELHRLHRDPHDRPGAAALAKLTELVGERSELDYGYCVGEQALATGGRRVMHAAGIPKGRIFFSGYWKL